ncbi:MAG TPA: flagellar basal body P-ring formation chaperone FlgA [Burkholderiales bacterium]|nr:flagellar basal body P-ring formation chaperone FlgA [Burkholderiales bacterium]
MSAGLLAFALPSGAAAEPRGERQNMSVVRQAVEDHLSREMRGLPGTVSYVLGSLDPRLSLAACPALQAFTAPGTRLWGKSSVGVRCAAPSWLIYVPVTIRVVDNFVVTARPVSPGQTLAAEDLIVRRGDLAELPAGVIAAPEAAIGRTAAVSVAAGQALRKDMLRAPLLIQQGQTVRVVARGKSFEVSVDGRALTAAHADQVVEVRLASGQVVNGLARPGPVVEAVSAR